MASPVMQHSYKNPVLPGFFPDPSCVCVDGIFYLVNSTFQWFPHIAVHISEDLVNWTPCKSAINEPGIITVNDAITRHEKTEGVLAPTIRYHKGTFFIIGSNVLLAGKADTFIIISTDPISGQWSKPIPVPFHGIDPSLFFDDDDKVYFQGTMFSEKPVGDKLPEGMLPQIVQMQIDPFTGQSLSGPPKPLMKAFGGGWAEGPHIYKKDGWYYGLLAEDGTEINHCVTMCRSRNIWGPFEDHPKNPVLTARKTNEYIQALGHADLFQDPHGSWWALSLGVRVDGDHQPLGRETFLCPVTWLENEWPVFNNWQHVKEDMVISQSLPIPQIRRLPLISTLATLDPKSPVLLYLRDPDLSNYEWIEGKTVILTGQAAGLSEQKGTASLVGFRQTSLSEEVAVTLDFQPFEGEQAGLTIYVDQFRHIELSVRGNSIGRTIVISTSSLKAEKTVHELSTTASGKLRLRIRCTEREYRFDIGDCVGDEVSNWTEVESVSTTLISEWGFTGPIIGMFATSNGKGATSPAKFSNLEIKA